MNPESEVWRKGDFVKVDRAIGAVVRTEDDAGIPEDHLGIWFGEMQDADTPLLSIVPQDVCEKITRTSDYH